MEQPKRRPGRPPAERRRIQMAFRVTPELSDQLVARAAAKGRSITQEMELMLEAQLLTEKLIGNGLVEVMKEFDRAGSNFEGDWPQNPEAYLAASHAALARLLRLAPEPWNFADWLTVFETALGNANRRRSGVGPQSGFVDEPDPTRQTFNVTDDMKPISRVNLDDEGKPIEATREFYKGNSEADEKAFFLGRPQP